MIESWQHQAAPGRYVPLLAAAVGIAALACSALRLMPRIVFNASESVPRGWYRVSPAKTFNAGDLVLVQLPHDVQSFAAKRGYLPTGVPLLKPVAAVAGDEVCIHHGSVYVAGISVARTLIADGQGRPLRPWDLCRTLVAGEVFLLASNATSSFDSRYFGPIDQSFIRGRATPLHLTRNRGAPNAEPSGPVRG